MESGQRIRNRERIATAARDLLANVSVETLAEFALAGLHVMRPNSGLLFNEVRAEIAQVFQTITQGHLPRVTELSDAQLTTIDPGALCQAYKVLRDHHVAETTRLIVRLGLLRDELAASKKPLRT